MSVLDPSDTYLEEDWHNPFRSSTDNPVYHFSFIILSLFISIRALTLHYENGLPMQRQPPNMSVCVLQKQVNNNNKLTTSETIVCRC